MHRLPAQGLRSRLSSDAGVTLIEVLISAVILVIVVGAVLTTIDASGRTTTVNKNRSVAATLAEQDQERLRAMSPTKLANFVEAPRQTNIDGVDYTIDSRSEWVVDATGATESCESTGSQASYLRISSSVTSSVVGTRVKPVTMRSIVSPRVDSFPEETGTLTVKVTDQLAQPVAGIPVTISGASNAVQNTNAFGCAVFSHIAVGDYTATLDVLGYVNEQGVRTYSLDTHVHEEQITPVAMTYAKASAITVNFETDPGTGSIASSAHAITVANAHSGALSTTGVATAAGSLTINNLFPYPDGYSAYTGRCALNSPTHPTYTWNADYYDTNPGFTAVTPGLVATVDAHQPSVNLQVIDSSNNAISGATVRFTPNPTSCGPTASSTTFDRTTGSSGFVPDRGLPFGKYTACVHKRLSNGTTYRETTGTLDNTRPTGVALTQVKITTSDTAGSC